MNFERLIIIVAARKIMCQNLICVDVLYAKQEKKLLGLFVALYLPANAECQRQHYSHYKAI